MAHVDLLVKGTIFKPGDSFLAGGLIPILLRAEMESIKRVPSEGASRGTPEA